MQARMNYWESCMRFPLLECREFKLLECNNYDYAYDRLIDACQIVKSEWKELKLLKVEWGTYKDFRVSTLYEAFEFSITEDLLVCQMLHIPKISKSAKHSKIYHKEFQGGLSEGLTLEEAVIYVAEHTMSKYRGNIIYNKKVFEKVRKHKKKKGKY